MSTDSPQSADNSALAQQVEAVYREADALTRALARARSIRQILGVLTLVLVVAIVVVFYQFGKQFTEEKFAQELPNTAQERLKKNSNQYMKEVNLLVDGVSPTVSDAFAEQVKKDMPKYFESLDKERDQLAATLPSKLEQKLEDHYMKLLEKQNETLRKEFPAIEDAQLHEKMIKNIDVAMQKLVKKYYKDEMDTQFQQLKSAWDQFPPAAAPKAGEPTTEDQFIGELLEMLRYKLSHGPEMARR